MNLQEDHPPVEGRWWDPLKPATKWHGTLILKAGEAAILQLVNYDISILQADSNRPLRARTTLHGITKHGKPVTLSDCICTQRTRTGSSEETQFHVRRVIMGEHCSDNDLMFDSVLVEFDYLNDWISYSRFQEKEISDDEGQKEIRIRLNQDYEFRFQAPGYAESLFYLGYDSTSSRFEFSIENRSNLQITYPQKENLQDILKDLHQWSWFLTLATRHQTHLLRLSVQREDVRLNIGTRAFKRPLDLWVSSSGKRLDTKALHPPDMNFTLPDIRDHLSEVISRWKELQIPFAAVLHRYFASIHRAGLQLEEEFLFRAQALEALFRIRAKNEKVSQKEAYGEVWEKAPASLRAKLGPKDLFVESVRTNRNYLTHYNPEDEKRADDFGDLFDLSQKLRFLLEARILTELGLSKNIIENAISPSRWGHLVRFDSPE